MNTHQIQYYVDRLMRAPDEVSFLVITISGSEDFLQLTADAGGAQIDFPLITERQRANESKIRQVAAANGLSLIENKSNFENEINGDRFLDINVDGSSDAVARVCRLLLREVFGATPEHELEFEEG